MVKGQRERRARRDARGGGCARDSDSHSPGHVFETRREEVRTRTYALHDSRVAGSAVHGVRLSRAALAVREHRAVDPGAHVLERGAHGVEHRVVGGGRGEDRVERERRRARERHLRAARPDARAALRRPERSHATHDARTAPRRVLGFSGRHVARLGSARARESDRRKWPAYRNP